MANVTGLVRSLPQNIGTIVSTFNEVLAVPSAATVEINSYTVPVSTSAMLQQVTVSGGNIATYRIYINGTQIDAARTYFGAPLTQELNYYIGNTGIALSAGDEVTVEVENFRPTAADFESRIHVLELT